VEIRRQPVADDSDRYCFLIDVKDSGIGIPADKLDHIFEPFFTTKDFGQGSGLGLAVSKEIVRQHGGQIQVVSVPGEGTCFTVVLPEVQAVSDEGFAAAKTIGES
jgi:two-component system sensor histidine kinase FlrB